KLVVAKGSARTKAFNLREPETIVGRKHGSGLRIPSATVSRKHCALRFHDGVLTVEDFQSANGTYLNGEKVTGKQIVRPGDQLEIGPVTFIAEYHLSRAAIDRLMSGESFEVVDEATVQELPAADIETPVVELPVVEDATAVEVLPEEEPVAAEADEDIVPMEVVPEKQVKKKPTPPQPPQAAEPVEAEVNQPLDFDDSAPWQLPDAGALRDLLTQMEDPKSAKK